MRNVLRNTHEVAHYWANRTQSEGRAASMFFRGDKIFSYGAHFCIARHLPDNVVAFTTRRYSTTTARHIDKVRSAARHLRAVYCNDPTDSALQNMAHARNAIKNALHASEAPRIRQTTRDKFKGEALHIAERANAYLAALPLAERGTEQPIDTSALEQIRASLIAAEQAAERIRAEQHAARLADLQTSLAQWRNHEIIVRTGLHSLPPALRLSHDRETIQTSHGADIPASFAPALWSLVTKVRAAGRDMPMRGVPCGAYSLNLVRADGSIVVGCHDIAFAELQGIARQLKYVEV